ncbi:hypothetical protein CBM2626_B10100 [Cupriavidus taiwanensis]|nr:hypothetical protein CBM2626_B10100 [Cupriavidus taiwanensis]
MALGRADHRHLGSQHGPAQALYRRHLGAGGVVGADVARRRPVARGSLSHRLAPLQRKPPCACLNIPRRWTRPRPWQSQSAMRWSSPCASRAGRCWRSRAGARRWRCSSGCATGTCAGTR